MNKKLIVNFLAAVLFLSLVSAGSAVAQGVTNSGYGPGPGANFDKDCAALAANLTGVYNSAFGYTALDGNTEGSFNTAVGAEALNHNGATATGFGDENTAVGLEALFENTRGNGNTATGLRALRNNTTGNDNIAVGNLAGSNLLDGSNDIYIGNPGLQVESGTIRIGAGGTHNQIFLAGINGTGVTGADVLIAADGQLGVPLSSARFKRDIRDMGGASQRLMELRPVTFRYKGDHTGTLQYGLVAEEVARVYPELVTYGPDGRVLTVRYSELTGMLLNELQKQNAQVHAEQKEIAELKADRDRERAERSAFEARLSALERSTEARNEGGKLAAAFNK